MIKRGDIVLLPYPFTDLSGQKARPALVISSDRFNQINQDAIFLFITKTEYKSSFDLRLEANDPRFPATGLRAASTFRCAKIITLEKNLARVKLGHAEVSLLGDIELRLKSLLDLC